MKEREQGQEDSPSECAPCERHRWNRDSSFDRVLEKGRSQRDCPCERGRIPSKQEDAAQKPRFL